MGKGPEPQPLAPTGPLGAVASPWGAQYVLAGGTGPPGRPQGKALSPAPTPPGLAPAVGSAVTPAVSERRIPVAKIWIWF